MYGFAAITITPVGLGSKAVVLKTGSVAAAGSYYISATALLNIDKADSAAYCYVTPTSLASTPNGNRGGSSAAGYYQQATVVDFFDNVAADDSFEMICSSNGNDAKTMVNNAALTATLVQLAVDQGTNTPVPAVTSNDDPRAPQ